MKYFEYLDKWLIANKDFLTPIKNKKYIGYRLNIIKPYLFNEKIDDCMIFEGKTKEEIFVKMCKYCYKNFTWKDDGEKIDLPNYFMEMHKDIYGKKFKYKTLDDFIESALDFYGFFTKSGIDCTINVQIVKKIKS
jgi:hypothetical protein